MRTQRKNALDKREEKLKGRFRIRNGNYEYRLTVAKGFRKSFALGTSDKEEAITQAEALDAQFEAPSKQVAMERMNAIKGFSKVAENLLLQDVWPIYSVHPNRAIPATISEREGYHSTYNEFVRFATTPSTENNGTRHSAIFHVRDLSPEICEAFSAYLKSCPIGVSTHNRKIMRLRKVFDCLKDYYNGDNPFRAHSLRRKEREEQDKLVRRRAFSRQEILKLREVLADDDPKHKVKNKPEIRVIFYLGMFTGQRLKDCVLLQWQDVDMEHRKINVMQFKTGKRVSIPMAPELQAILNEAKAWRVDQYVSPNVAKRYNHTNAIGKNDGNNLVDIDVQRPIRWIGLEPAVKVEGRKKSMSVYGFHSLRHTFVSFCFEHNVPAAVVKSIIGDDLSIIGTYYTHVGDDAQMLAVMSMSDTKLNSTPSERIKKALEFIEALKTPGEDILRLRDILNGEQQE